jgi:hypothetical protein
MEGGQLPATRDEGGNERGPATREGGNEGQLYHSGAVHWIDILKQQLPIAHIHVASRDRTLVTCSKKSKVLGLAHNE